MEAELAAARRPASRSPSRKLGARKPTLQGSLGLNRKVSKDSAALLNSVNSDRAFEDVWSKLHDARQQISLLKEELASSKQVLLNQSKALKQYTDKVDHNPALKQLTDEVRVQRDRNQKLKG